MLNSEVKNNLEKMKSSALILDIETSAFFSNNQEINIRTNFDEYVTHAKVKWFGAYSYKDNRIYLLDAQKDAQKVLDLCNSHDILIGFNSSEFDIPILKNNGYLQEGKYYTEVDCMVVLGKPTGKTKDGYPYKDRGTLMNYKFKRNSLKCIAETMGLETQKGDIDYKLFHKDVWTASEEQEIKKYLNNDIMATKQMFDKLWNFWMPFAEFLDEKNIYNLSWIKNSIASLTYKSACKVYDVEPTYSDKKTKTEEMGGRVIEPKYEEMRNVWYIDYTSLYPHIFSMFNLFSEVDKDLFPDAWHGNKLFKVKGYYDISKWNVLCEEISKRLKERIHLKKIDKDSPMIYTLKIWLNSLYGASRSSVFEKIHSKNCGWDCCLLGQQIHELTEDMMETFGFETLYGDTDGFMMKAKDEKYNNKKYVKECLAQIIDIIKDNVPFPVDTFNIDIENYIYYIMFPFSEQPIIDVETGKKKKIKNRLVKERKGRKKNYLFLYKENDELKTKIVGLPIKKDNATPLGMKIFNEVLEKQIIENKRAKFSKEHIDNIINEYLKNKEIMKLLAVEYRVKRFDTYKKESQIQAQISKGYFDGREGIISLIKNKSVGKAGLGTKYCTIEEAISNNLTVKELDLDKIYNELEPFILHEFWVKNTETNDEYLIDNDAYEASKDFLEKIDKIKKFDKVLKTKKIKKIDDSINLSDNLDEKLTISELQKKYNFNKDEHKFSYIWKLKDAIFTKDKGKVFSCFACGGGSTMGYKLAGYDVIGCNEIDKKMFDVYCENHHPKYAYNEDIRIFKNRNDLPEELYNLDILDGSPPCSSFSIAGNREKDWGKKKKFQEGQEEQVLDTLFFDFIDLANKLQPKMVIAENVKGLMMGKAKDYIQKIYEELDKAGYYTKHYLLNSKNMGVPQRRERVFFISIRKDLNNKLEELNLKFNEKEIPIKYFIKGIKKRKTQNYLPNRYGDIMLDVNRPCNTMVSINRYWLDENTLIDDMSKTLIGSFPLDYKLIHKNLHRLIGMSVPPLMISQISSIVYDKMLSKLDKQ